MSSNNSADFTFFSPVTISHTGTAAFTVAGGASIGGDITATGALNLAGALNINNGGSNYSLNFPTGSGLSGQVLTSGGSGQTLTWTYPSAGSVTSVGLTAPSFLSVSNTPITSTGNLVLDYSGTPLPVLYGGSGTTTSTGTGSVVLNNTPTFITPILGAASGTSLQLSSLSASSSVQTDISKNLISVANTGTGSNVLATSPTLVTPILGAASATSITASGNVSGSTITSTVAIGTAPFTVTSTTNVPNLNASTLSGATFASPGSIGSTTAGSGSFTTVLTSSTLTTNGLLTAAAGLTSTAGATTLGATTIGVITGTSASFSSLTANYAVATDSNKNLVSVGVTGTGNYVLNTSPTLVTPILGAATATSISASGNVSGNTVTSTVGPGTAPLVISSDTLVSNLNANYLGGATFAAPTSIGSTTANSGAFTTITSSGTVSTGGLLTANAGLTSTAGTTTLGTTSTGALSSTTGSFTGAVNMNSNKINNLATPTATTDAATKGYVDISIQGLSAKESVIAATTIAGTLTTSFANGSLIDGVTLVTGERILIKDQTNQVENGIYNVSATGSPTRAFDFATGTEQGGSFVFVESGTVNASSGFVCTNIPTTDVVGTNNLTFTQFSGAGEINAGTGLSKSGNMLSVNANQSQITQVGTLSSLTTGPLTGSSATFSSTLQVTGTSTMADITATSLSSTGNVTGSTLTSTISIGTSPIAVTSNTLVSNLNVNYLGGGTFAAPTSIGSTTPNSGAFTTLSSSGTLTTGGLLTASSGLTSTAGTTTLGTTNTGPITSSGDITLEGSSSGAVTLHVQPAAGTFNFNLPTTIGTSGQVLTTSGSATEPFTWTNPSAGSVTSVGLTAPSFLTVSNSPITSTGNIVLSYSGTALPVSSGGTGTITSTGTGSVVLSTSPTLVTPTLGAATATSLNISGLTPSSAVQTDSLDNLITISNTGTGNNVLATSPTLVTPVLGAASGTSLQLSSLTPSYAVATDSSKNLVSVSTTGTGSYVLASSPTLVNPTLGSASATTLTSSGNNTASTFTSTVVTGTAPLIVSSTTNVANLNASSLSGATFASPGPIGGTTASTGAFTTLTTTSTITAGGLITASNGLTSTVRTTTLGSTTIGAITGTSANFSSLTASSAVATDASSNLVSVTNTGSGNNVLATSPTLVTPILGAASATSLTASGNISGSTITSTVINGTPPFTVTSTTNVPHLNASSISGNTFPSPGPIGATTANTGAFTSLTTTGTITSGDLITASNGITSTVGVNTFGATTIGAITGTSANFSGLTASSAVATDSLDNLISVPNTGTGNNVLSNSATLVTPNIGAATASSINVTGLSASSAVQTDASKNLVSVTNTGTGNNVLATSPILITPTLGAASATSINASGNVSGSTLTSTVITGTAPLIVTSTTNVANLNASSLSGATFASPGPIGYTTASSGAFSTLSASSTVNATGLITASGGLTSTVGTTTLGVTNTGALSGTTANFSSLTVSSSVATDASKNLVSVANTGTGNNVLANTPTLITPILGAASATSLNVSSLSASSSVQTDVSNNLVSVTNTGTGNNVLSTSPVLVTPTLGAASATSISASGNVSGSTITSTVATGTAPLIVSSTTNVANLNSSTLNGNTFDSPGPIGDSTASTGAFTNLMTSGTLSTGGLLTANAGLTSTASTTTLGTTNTGALSSSTGSFTGTLNMNSNLINNVANPVSATDAANKQYVDMSVQGLSAKQSVIAATTTAGTLTTSFTATSVIDGITLATGNRILIKDQTNPVENGIYVVAATGSPTRSSDFATRASESGAYVFVDSGTVNGSAGFVCNNLSGSDVVGTNGITFTQFSGAGEIIAGTGLDKSGNTLSVDPIQSQITQVGTLSSLTTGPLTGTTASFSSTLDVTGTSTLTSINSSNLTASGVVSGSTITSTVATGTAPLTVTSTTNVPNLNASSLSGATFSSPGPIGSVTASTGAFTTASTSGTLTSEGLLTASSGLTSTAGTTTLGTTNTGTITSSGDITLEGSSSGAVTLHVQPVAGTFNFNLPTTIGTSGQVLTTSGSATEPFTWTNPSAGSVTSVGLTAPSFLTVSNSPITSTGNIVLSYSGTALPVSSGGTGTITSTGTGSLVLNSSPTLVTPVLGAASATSLNVSSLSASSSVQTDGLSNLITITNTGTGNNVLATSPVLVTPNIGAASASSLNVSGLTASSAVATDSSKNLISVANTGSGSNVLATSPVLVTPTLGVASATSITASVNVSAPTLTSSVATGTPPFTVTSTTNVVNLNASSLSGFTFASPGPIGGTTPDTGAFTSLTTTGAITSGGLITASNGLTSTVGATTLGATTIGAITGTSASFSGLSPSSAVQTDSLNNLVSVANTGTGLNVLNNSPTFITPTLGSASASSLNVSGLTASYTVATDASKNLISVGVSGTGNYVLVNNPVLVSPTLGAASATSLAASGNISGSTITSTVITGTAPLVVASTTNVANLNASSINGSTFHVPGPIGDTTPDSGNFTTVNTSGTITAGGLITASNGLTSTVGTTTLGSVTAGSIVGTSLQLSNLSVSSAVATDASKNLISVATTGSGMYVLATSPTLTTPVLGAASATSITASGNISASTFTSTVINGTAPFTVTSSTNVANLNASSLSGATFTSPGPIGSTTASTGAFTSLSTTGAITSGGLITASNGLTSTVGVTTLGSTTIGAITGTSASFSGLTASSAVATDASSNLISVTNTGTGNNVLATSPVLVTPTLGAASATSLNVSSLTASSAVATDASKNLISVTNTGTGNNVLATSPSLISPNIGAATGSSLSVTGNVSSNILTSTVSVGTAPLTVTSDTLVTNLNANYLGGATFASPTAIGSTVANTGAFTTLTTSSTLTSGGLITASNGLTSTAGTSTLGVTNTGALSSTTGSFTGTLNMNSNYITNVTTPVNPTDAANKYYVDMSIQGLSAKESVIAATTTAGTLTTSFANGSIIDGITLVTGERILIKDQTNQVENGIYIVAATGSPTRSSDFATGTEQGGTFVFVESGTVNASSGFVCTDVAPNDVVGTNNMTFTQFSGAGEIIAGTGLSKSGNTLSVNAAQTQITSVGSLISLSTGPLTGTTASFSSTLAVTGTSSLGTVTGTSITSTGTLSAPVLTSTVAIGTAPLTVISTTNVPNLNASLLNGNTFSNPGPIGSGTASTGAFTTGTYSSTLNISGLLTASGGFTSTGATTLAATTIGAITGTSATFSSLTGSSSVQTDGSSNLITITNTGTGFNVLNNSPSLITPVLGVASATSISASGNISGNTLTSTVSTGTAPLTVASTSVIPNLNASLLNGNTFANPGSIGSTTPGSASFTTLSTSSTLTSGGLLTASSGLTSTAGTTTLGTTNATTLALSGSLAMSGSASGIITIQPQAAAGTYNLNLPSSSGTSGQILTSGGGGTSAMTWTNPFSATQYTFAGNQNVTNGDITNLAYSSGVFEVTLAVNILATTNLTEIFHISGVLSSGGSGWNLNVYSPSGDATGVTFTITNTGQVQYSSTSYTGFVSLTFTWSTYMSSNSGVNYVSGINTSETIPSTSGVFFTVTPASATDTYTASSGTLSAFNGSYIGQPTLIASNTGVTTTVANTLAIAGPPITGTNETIGTAYTLNVLSGNSNFTGDVDLTASNAAVVSLKTNSTTASYNFNLPTSPGTTGQVLTSAGGSSNAMTWSSVVTSTALSATGANNQSSPVNVTGFNYTSGYFEVLMRVTVVATTNALEMFKLYGVLSNNASTGWAMSEISVAGDTTGVSFSITSAGQLQYTSPSYPGFVSLSFNWNQ